MSRLLQNKTGTIFHDKRNKEYSIYLKEIESIIQSSNLNNLKRMLIKKFQRANDIMVIVARFSGLNYTITRVKVEKTRSLLPFINGEELCSK